MSCVRRMLQVSSLFPVVPALLFRQLDRGGGAGGEGDLVDPIGSLDRVAVSRVTWFCQDPIRVNLFSLIQTPRTKSPFRNSMNIPVADLYQPAFGITSLKKAVISSAVADIA